jgi:hypothetical protein
MSRPAALAARQVVARRFGKPEIERGVIDPGPVHDRRAAAACVLHDYGTGSGKDAPDQADESGNLDRELLRHGILRSATPLNVARPIVAVPPVIHRRLD